MAIFPPSSRKDNQTDLVGHLVSDNDNSGSGQPAPTSAPQVVANDGEVVSLGQNVAETK